MQQDLEKKLELNPKEIIDSAFRDRETFFFQREQELIEIELAIGQGEKEKAQKSLKELKDKLSVFKIGHRNVFKSYFDKLNKAIAFVESTESLPSKYIDFIKALLADLKAEHPGIPQKIKDKFKQEIQKIMRYLLVNRHEKILKFLHPGTHISTAEMSSTFPAQVVEQDGRYSLVISLKTKGGLLLGKGSSKKVKDALRFTAGSWFEDADAVSEISQKEQTEGKESDPKKEADIANSIHSVNINKLILGPIYMGKDSQGTYTQPKQSLISPKAQPMDRLIEDLRERKSKLNVESFFLIMHTLTEGLTTTHKSGIIHRDVKTANFLIDRDEKDNPLGKVSDFSHAIHEDKAKFKKFFAGTRGWKPPEKIQYMKLNNLLLTTDVKSHEFAIKILRELEIKSGKKVAPIKFSSPLEDIWALGKSLQELWDAAELNSDSSFLSNPLKQLIHQICYSDHYSRLNGEQILAKLNLILKEMLEKNIEGAKKIEEILAKRYKNKNFIDITREVETRTYVIINDKSKRSGEQPGIDIEEDADIINITIFKDTISNMQIKFKSSAYITVGELVTILKEQKVLPEDIKKDDIQIREAWIPHNEPYLTFEDNIPEEVSVFLTEYYKRKEKEALASETPIFKFFTSKPPQKSSSEKDQSLVLK